MMGAYRNDIKLRIKEPQFEDPSFRPDVKSTTKTFDTLLVYG